MLKLQASRGDYPLIVALFSFSSSHHLSLSLNHCLILPLTHKEQVKREVVTEQDRERKIDRESQKTQSNMWQNERLIKNERKLKTGLRKLERDGQ